MTTALTTIDASAAQLHAQLGLRRHFLRAYHADNPPQVLDCCHAPGEFWSVLRREFSLASYWGLEKKPKAGHPDVDPAAVLAQDGWRFTMIDLHLRKSPWLAWTSLLPRVSAPLTVFLTVGRFRDADALVLEVLGLKNLQVPLPLAKKLQPVAVPYFLHMAVERGLSVVEAGEVEAGRNRRAIGMHLVPAAGAN